MKNFISLFVLFALAVMFPAFAVDADANAVCIVVDKLAAYTPPVLKIIAFLVLIGGILFAVAEFFNRQMKWVLGGFAVGVIAFAIFWAMASSAEPIFEGIKSAVGC